MRNHLILAFLTSTDQGVARKQINLGPVSFDGSAILDAGRVAIHCQQHSKLFIVSCCEDEIKLTEVELTGLTIGKFKNGGFLLV